MSDKTPQDELLGYVEELVGMLPNKDWVQDDATVLTVGILRALKKLQEKPK